MPAYGGSDDGIDPRTPVKYPKSGICPLQVCAIFHKKKMRRFFLFILVLSLAWQPVAAQDDQLLVSQDTGYIPSTADSIVIRRDNSHVQSIIDSFAREQKERDKKSKLNAMLRIGMGVVMLGVFIVGMRRKKKG